MTRFATVNPATGDVVETFAGMTSDDVEAALHEATAAYERWRGTDLATRSSVLGKVSAAHRRDAEDLARLMTLEMGKPVAQARAEVELAASIYAFYAEKGPALLADEELDIAGTGRAVVQTAPIGPLLGVMPWNFPLYQVARFVAPNLLLGNTVVLKHAPNCPQQALRIAAMIDGAGGEPGIYRNAFATDEQVADMVADPRLRGVSLTGSVRAGRAIGELAGRHLKKCVLELGGSDPFVVLDGADVDRVVEVAATARFTNAGQVCTSSKRFIVESPVCDAFVDGLVAQAAAWVPGDPGDEATRLGPLASEAARRALADQVQDAIDHGATVHRGGAIPDGPGSFYPATVLSGVTPQMRAYREELFGPVAVVYRVGSSDEAVALANDSPYGLGGAVFARDDASAWRVAQRLDVGMVGVNTVVRSAPDMPFGGVKESGIGRELGRFGLDEFANKKLVRIV
jgi:succinate-semialdehyde dehydrogenase/glutarate-semialdehyde dehydrogenase